MIKIKELNFNPVTGHDELMPAVDLDYDPSQYLTCEDAAKGLYAALRVAAEAYGQNPDSEVHLRSPEESDQKCWQVFWEAGPFEWAIQTSFEVTGPWGYTEPYWSFDLCFVENY